MSYIYLASPYTHVRAAVRHERYLKVAEVTARLLHRGIHVFSPIVHCHDIATRHNLPKDMHFWREYDTAMLKSAVGLWVLQLDTWEKSEGVKFEIALAHKYNIPVKMVNYPLKEIPV